MAMSVSHQHAGEEQHYVMCHNPNNAKRVLSSWFEHKNYMHALAIACCTCLLLACVQYVNLSLLCDLASSASKIPSCRMASGFQNL